MIRGFETSQPPEAPIADQFQWGPAFAAGFIAGAVLLIVPHGNPWGGPTFFSSTIMGRSVSSGAGVPALWAWIIHLGVSLIYGLVISRVVTGLRMPAAILGGAVTGFLLYLLNFGVVHLWWPAFRGNEVGVLVTHVVFGLLATGAYKGLLRRKVVARPETWNGDSRG